MGLFICTACREQLPETPRLDQARKLQLSGEGVPAPKRVKMAPKHLQQHLKGGTLVMEDKFERNEFGVDWRGETPRWKLQRGEVINHHADNKGLWLNVKLPKGDVRIEFDVRSDKFNRKDAKGRQKEVFDGDVKCEAFNTEPKHQSGYIFIFGGWGNKINRIARLEEHGNGEGAVVMDGPKYPVKAGHTYRLKIIRVGNILAFYVDDKHLVHYTDPNPIPGRYFGFNNWRSRLTFDNLAIYDLSKAVKK
ncbi:MAG TPA: hypothetical protein EYN66_22640 [Myxococcales bacterium]|nr:hypothetical protein [Myxococcales bacterium]